MNAIENTADETGRSEIEDLLPWHAAGTLNRRDAERVEAALAGDPELARRYEMVREELGETIHLNETLGAPSARAMSALFAKIDAEPARRSVPSLNLGARIGEFFASFSPRTLAWSATAAALAIVLQAGIIAGVMIKDRSPGNFETASAPATVTEEGSYALIRFQSQANAAQITQFLETNKLSIAGGPSAGGLYRVRIAGKDVPKPEVDRVIKTLQIDPVVGLIVPTK
jgi:anti-sigma factor RsiW